MKKHLLYSFVILLGLILFIGSQSQASDKGQNLNSTNKVEFKKDQLRKDFKKQWDEVQKKYPAVAIAFMYHEVAIVALLQNRYEEVKELIEPYLDITGTEFSSAAKAETLRFTNCINEFKKCDMRAGSDGGFSVDEVSGCGSSFSNCWKGNN